MRSDEIHPGDLIAGKYRVRTILGRSHGLLLEAFHTEFDQRVVVKILPAGHGDAKEIERFRREARTLAKLESEHVARIIDVGSQDDGSFYLVRQYLEGTDLSRHLRQSGPLPLADAVLMLSQAAEAIAETHSHGIILRELQPSHLFLTRRASGTPLIKVIDFGTAKLMREMAAPVANQELTATAMFGLSPYSSPELVRKAKNVDVRADVWSLGAVLYEILTGRPPFTGDMAVLMLQITKEEPAPITQLRQDLPAEIDQIMSWALAKDVDGRFRNVHALVHALLPYASSEAKVLIERIGQITQSAKARKQGGGVPAAPAPVVMPPVAQSSSAGAARVRTEDSVTRIKGSAFAGPGDELEPTGATPAGAAGSSPGGVAAPAGSPGGASATSPASASPSAGAAPGAIREGGGGLPVPPVRPLAAPPPQKDRRVLYGVLAALAVLVPVLVAIFVLSRKASEAAAVAEKADASQASTSTEAAPSAEAAGASTAKAAAPAEPTALAEPAASAEPSESASAEAAAEPAPLASPPSGNTRPPVVVSRSITTKRPPSSSSTSTSSDKDTELPPLDSTTKSESTPSGSSGPGTLVAVATGGSCSFSVNGASKGTSSSIKLSMPPGTYSLTCKPSSGATKSKSVTVKSGQTAFAAFKL
jgi:eukaryotic-like serine/threonine-protein kinase